MDQALTSLLVRVDPRFPGAWESLSHYLQSAIRESGCERDWSIEDVFALCVAGQCHLWALVCDGRIFGALVTQLSVFPRRTVLDALLVGADANTEAQWFQCLEQLRGVAKSLGASAITGTGRDGWFRKLHASRRRYVIEMDI